MYIQITTKCNMECAHCCYSCTKTGEDMSIETFRKCLENGDECISIGGGEPTIHPRFSDFLLMAIGGCEYVWLATNGKETEIALVLAKLAKNGIIGCDLSQDDYHECIDDLVIDAFMEGKQRSREYINSGQSRDMRGIRNVNAKEINQGRCDFGADDGCVCEDFFVRPNGDVYQCGCTDSPKIGNVNEGFETAVDGCYKNPED